MLGIGLFVLIAFYVVILWVLWQSWNKIQPAANRQLAPDTIHFSIVVAARNEAENITHLLQSFNQLNYPRNYFEVIIIDDHSTDSTADLVQNFEANFSLCLLKATQQGKKNAITQAIHAAKGDYVITTDADCQVPKDWLNAFCNHIIQQQAKFIAAPVSFYQEQGLFQAMQTIELASLVGTGGATIQLGKPTMCNGANVCYEKNAFLSVGGYEQNEHIASGDDIFLMQKIALQYPNSVSFIKGSAATVHTKPATSWFDFFNQRLRWANKWNSYQNKIVSVVAVAVFAFHLCWIMGIAYFLIHNVNLAFSLLFLKAIAEYVFLQRVLKDCGKKCELLPFIALQLFYSFYVLFFGIIVHFDLKFIWKNRKYQH
jgi:cellulose synthase/poly-beta-1,6-N-acetylglucosamine synthase-like glycosyltransferase